MLIQKMKLETCVLAKTNNSLKKENSRLKCHHQVGQYFHGKVVAKWIDKKLIENLTKMPIFMLYC